MDIRKRIFIGFGIAVGIIIIIILLILLRNRRPAVVPVVPTSTPNVIELDSPVQEIVPPVITEFPLRSEDDEERYVRQLSRIVVERLGSFSNQNDNSHIADVESITTASMQNWLATQALTQQREYQGQTTQLIESKLVSKTADQAVVSIGVQESLKANGTTTVRYRTGRVELSKVGEDWLVNGIFFDEGQL